MVCVTEIETNETVEKETTERDPGPDLKRERERGGQKERQGKRGGAFEKESGDGALLRAVYMTDHQQNSQDNRRKKIHNTRQTIPPERKEALVLWIHTSLRAWSPTYTQRKPNSDFCARQNKIELSGASQIQIAKMSKATIFVLLQ